VPKRKKRVQKKKEKHENEKKEEEKEEKEEHQTPETLIINSKEKKRLYFPFSRPSDHDKWEIIEDDFIAFCALNASYLSEESYFAPYAHLSDGYVDILTIPASECSRSDMISFLVNGTGTPDHINLPKFMHYYKARAFTLEPLSTGSFGLDGERTEYAPIYCEVLRGIARLMAIW